ncbi:MAG: right-handed parallel beta-helix repeat-containing protein [Methanolinea sp.]|nr:right-handed parallel beta-helix repeat-containing protein [Methanolinea sp.]
MTVQKPLWGSEKLFPVLTIALLCAFLLVPGFAGAAIPITGPTVISEPGSYYLATDIRDSPEPVAILIQCSNVVIDGKGKIIDGTDKAESIGIKIYNAAMTLVNVVIRNVVLSDWDSGIFINDVKNSQFEKITSKSNLNHGVLVAHSMGNTFSKITATDNGGVGVLLYFQSNHNTLTEITSQNNGLDGVRFRFSNGNRLQKSKVLNNGQHGINFDEEANYNTIIQSTINGNGRNGIRVYKSNYNTITQNTLTGNKNTGIYCEQSDYNVISGNTVKDSNVHGIQLTTDCVDNVVSKNVVQNSTINGIDIRSDSKDNLINGNTVDKCGAYGLMLAGNQNVIYDNLVRENALAGMGIFSNAKDNIIFNNYFYNVNNTRFGTTNANTWNLTRGEVKSITDGKYSGGNSWGQPNGQGFSQITPDSNKDGICDSPYTLAANNIDKLPLKFKKK